MAVLNGDSGNNYIVGTIGDDTLNGNDGIDTIEADLGNDTLNGGLDNDYLYGGEGNDVLNGDEGDDELRGEAGDDVLNGGTGYDNLRGGSGNDVLNGGLDNTSDYMYGESGNDTYLFGLGFGQDSINDYIWSNDGTIELNTIQLLADIAVSDVRLTRINQDLQLSVVGTPDNLTLQGYFYVDPNNSTPYQAYQIQFADGTTWDKIAIQTSLEALATTGTEGTDTLVGDASDNSINGLAGNDYLYGGEGNDVLNGDEGSDELNGEAGDDVLNGGTGYDNLRGGSGNDVLNGGLDNTSDYMYGESGNDTYQFGLGFGQDSINDYIWSNDGTIELNTIQLLADIAVSDVRLTRINQDLQLSVVGTTDNLTLQGYFYVESYNNTTPQQVYQIQFADGTTWDKTAIRNKVLETAIVGTEANDVLSGTAANDYIAGLAGDDTLNGNGGIDTIEADLGVIR